MDTTIIIHDRGEEQKKELRFVLPYTLHLDPRDLYDEDDKLVRVCIGSLDTKDNIVPQLARLYGIIRNQKFYLKDTVIHSGGKELTMEDCHIGADKNQYGYFFTFESVRKHCHIKNSQSPQI